MAQKVLMDKYQMLLFIDCRDEIEPALDTLDIFSFANSKELNRKILEIMQLPDKYPYFYFCRNVAIDFNDTNINIGISIHNSPVDTVSIPRIIRARNELTFTMFSNDSILYGTSLLGNADSITSWVYEYFMQNAALYKYYTPSFSDLVLTCDADYHLDNLERILQNAIAGYVKAIEDFSLTHFHIPFKEQDTRHVLAFKHSVPLNIALDLKGVEQKRILPPDSLFFQEPEVSLFYPQNIDAILLPEESYLHLERTPYQDTLVVDFFTGRDYIPFYIWQDYDTIKIKKWESYWALSTDTLEEYLSKKYATNEYHIGGLFSDGRAAVYIYHVNNYLLTNDTLYSLQLKTNLPADSTLQLALKHRIFNDGTYGYTTEYLEILNDNSFLEYDVLFYKGLVCSKFINEQPYYTHQIIMEDYWETDFGIFYQFSHHSNTHFSYGSNTLRTEYIINDRFEFYKIGHNNKRLEVFKLEQTESDFEKYKLIHCR